jgi:glyoxylase-like metal-dependent hydrolase (beta-lactamase superfamily II)
MSRRLGAISGALLVAAGVMLAAQNQDFSKVQITTEKLGPGLFMLTGAGGNIGLSVGEDAAFIIDDQYAPMTDKIVEAVKKVTDKPVKFVINTHWHGDHTGGNENFGKAGAVIIAHDNVRRRMSTEQALELFKMKFPPSPRVALPVVTFAESVTLHLNDDEVQVTHVPPAHTDGDAVIRFTKANVVHMGDLFMNGLYPFIDPGSGSVDGVVAAADRTLAAIDDTTKIIPGHGPLASKADYKAFRDMLAAVRDKVRELKKAGKTLADVQAAKPTSEFDAKWGKGFLNGDAFVAVVYSTLRD